MSLDITEDPLTKSHDNESLCYICGRTLKPEHFEEHVESIHAWNFLKKNKRKVGRKAKTQRPGKIPTISKQSRLLESFPVTFKAQRENQFRSERKMKRSNSLKKFLPKKKLFSSLKLSKKIVDELELSQNFIPQRTPLFLLHNKSKPFPKPENEKPGSSQSKTSGVEVKNLFLDVLAEAMNIERNQTDTSKFGSVFVNLSQALVSGACKASDLCFQIIASTARLKNSKSNTMVYSSQEYIFWEYISYIHKESSLRNLTGRKAFGLEKHGQAGTQDPIDLEFNLPIPSRTEREKNNQYRPVKMSPGCIQESLQSLKMENFKDLNLSIDEKHISSGMEMQVNETSVTILGDQEYFGTATANKA